MGRVDDQVHQHLADLARQTAHPGQGTVQIEFHLRQVFPLVARQDDGALDRPVEIDIGLLLGAGVGELLHRPHQLADPFDPFLRPLQGLGYLRCQEVQVGVGDGRLHLV